MKKSLIMLVMIASAIFFSSKVKAQWQSTNSLSDLNTWSGQPAFIGWYNTAGNVPAGEGYGAGIQMALKEDTRFGSQIVIPTWDNQIYYRRNLAGTWDPWYKVWSSSNLNKSDVDFTAQTVNCTNVYANGNIWAKTIKVEMTNPWPDYVFKSDYYLPSLTDVKIYIDKNHHLPNLPTAEDVSRNGIDLGEMVKLQTEKIEVLTLYLIQKDDELKKQQEEIALLKRQEERIAALERALNSLKKL
jgi:hypothetical protein